MGFIQKIHRHFKYGVVRSFFFGKLSKIGIGISPFYLMREDSLDREHRGKRSSTLIPDLDQWTVRELVSDDYQEAADIGKIFFSYLTDQKIEEMTQNGYFFMGLWHHHVLVAIVWCNLQECNETILSFPLKEDEVYLAGMFTKNEYRGKRIAPYLRMRLIEFLAQTNRTKCYSITMAFNTPAVKFKKKLNARAVKLYLDIHLFKKFRHTFLAKDFEKKG